LAPPVNAAFLRASHRKESDTRALEAGRTIFVNRCIACHALPKVAAHDAGRIPRIVGVMSNRAHLTVEQKELLTKYILAVRAQ
jgi:cytochrome c2